MKINLEFDSETKLGSLTLNGEEVENLSSLNVYKWGEEEMSVEIRTTEHEEDEKYTKMTTIYASTDKIKVTDDRENKQFIDSLANLIQSVA